METKKRILVFGATGSGKTSVINLLTNNNYPTNQDAIGCTLKSSIVYFEDYEIIDTVGLGEASFSTTNAREAFSNLIDLLKKSMNGFNLLIYVKSVDRLKQEDENNYKLFVEEICKNRIPILCCCTKVDQVDVKHHNEWWLKNKDTFYNNSMRFNDGLSGCFATPQRYYDLNKQIMEDSKKYLWVLVKKMFFQ